MLVRRSSSAWRACSGSPRTRSIQRRSRALGTGRKVHAAERVQRGRPGRAPRIAHDADDRQRARLASDGAPGDADGGASRRTTCPTPSAIRPELARDGFGHDHDARLRRAFRRREAAPAHDIDAKHVEVFGRHGQLVDRHSAWPCAERRRRFDHSTRLPATTRPRSSTNGWAAHGLEQRGAPWFVGDGDPHRVARPHAGITRRGGEGTSQKDGGADQEERRCADLDGDQGMPRAAADAHPSSLRRASSRTRSRRVACSAGASPKNTVDTMAPATRNTSTRQSAAGAARFNMLTNWANSGGIVRHRRRERRLEEQPRDDKTACRRRERKQEALREQLPDDAPA